MTDTGPGIFNCATVFAVYNSDDKKEEKQQLLPVGIKVFYGQNGVILYV